MSVAGGTMSVAGGVVTSMCMARGGVACGVSMVVTNGVSMFNIVRVIHVVLMGHWLNNGLDITSVVVIGRRIVVMRGCLNIGVVIREMA